MVSWPVCERQQAANLYDDLQLSEGDNKEDDTPKREDQIAGCLGLHSDFTSSYYGSTFMAVYSSHWYISIYRLVRENLLAFTICFEERHSDASLNTTTRSCGHVFTITYRISSVYTSAVGIVLVYISEICSTFRSMIGSTC